ncbi:uncharacterized protein LOC141857502 [Brevipalpus obovatus]|uniref:uncharacterized protein LOC141857502 n=1 Tax=Brevipalpus obovatus TaxID=246614 RepID=UPI003D9FAE9E
MSSLRTKRGKYVPVSDEMRKLVCSMRDEGSTPKEISDITKISYRTVISIINIYKSSGRIEKNRVRVGRPETLTEQDKVFIKELLDENCTLPLEKIKSELLRKKLAHASIRTIGRAISSFNYSFKRTSAIPEAKNTGENIDKRYDYALNFCTLDENRMFFIDEAGFQVNMRRSYGRSKKDEKAVKIVPKLRMPNYSLCAAINKSGVYFFELMDRAYNIIHFSEYLDQLLAYFERDSISGAIIIMDNVRFHRNPEIVQKVESKGHQVFFLPPYSPFLNPIEEVFSKWKGIVRQANCKNEDELYHEVKEASKKISSDNCIAYFQHMKSFIPICLRKEPVY